MTASVLSCLMLLISTGFVTGGTENEFFEVDKGDDGKADGSCDVGGNGSKVVIRCDLAALPACGPSFEDVDSGVLDLDGGKFEFCSTSRGLLYLNGFLKGCIPQTVLLLLEIW